LKIRLCFVCHGNICRSPTAEAIMISLVEENGFEELLEVESAGTSAEHIDEDADPRSQECAVGRGLSLDGVAVQFDEADFERFDYILAMDSEVQEELTTIAPDEESQEHVFLLRAFDPGSRGDREVPDPYFGGEDGFERVFDVCDAACRALIAHLIEHHDLPD
jgi:protein-tyrosine phosphatase